MSRESALLFSSLLSLLSPLSALLLVVRCPLPVARCPSALSSNLSLLRSCRLLSLLVARSRSDSRSRGRGESPIVGCRELDKGATGRFLTHHVGRENRQTQNRNSTYILCGYEACGDCHSLARVGDSVQLCVGCGVGVSAAAHHTSRAPVWFSKALTNATTPQLQYSCSS